MFTLDDLDHHIIGELRRNGREANTEIARRLGVSETTVRNRIQRLISEGVLQIAAVTNLPRLGYHVDVAIGISCEQGQALNVARRVAEMKAARFVSYVTGRYDLLVAATFRTQTDLLTFLNEELGRIPGIQKTETMHQLRIVKRAYDYWESPLVEQSKALMPSRDGQES